MGSHEKGPHSHKKGSTQIPVEKICKQYGHDKQMGNNYTDMEGRVVPPNYSGQKYRPWTCKRQGCEERGLDKA